MSIGQDQPVPAGGGPFNGVQPQVRITAFGGRQEQVGGLPSRQCATEIPGIEQAAVQKSRHFVQLTRVADQPIRRCAGAEADPLRLAGDPGQIPFRDP